MREEFFCSSVTSSPPFLRTLFISTFARCLFAELPTNAIFHSLRLFAELSASGASCFARASASTSWPLSSALTRCSARSTRAASLRCTTRGPRLPLRLTRTRTRTSTATRTTTPSLRPPTRLVSKAHGYST